MVMLGMALEERYGKSSDSKRRFDLLPQSAIIADAAEAAGPINVRRQLHVKGPT